MRRALGQRIGAFMTTVIRDYGVDLRLGDAVERIEAGSASTVAAVILRDGTRIDTDLVAGCGKSRLIVVSLPFIAWGTSVSH